MTLPKKAEGLVQRYERNATLRALVQLIPLSIGSAIDTAVITKMQAIREDRVREFFDELGKGTVELCPELLGNNDFLHCFSITTEAVLKTHRAEKIRILARLLSSSIAKDRISGVSEYEELLNILVDLSGRELAILSLLDTFETNFPKVGEENDLQRANRYWELFSKQVNEQLAIAFDEIDALLIRLTRSGCYEIFNGYGGPWGGTGKLTPTFRRLKALALEESTLGTYV